MEAVDEREGETAAVVALTLVDGDAEGAYRPVVVAGVEQVGGGQSEAERLFQERFFNREVHTAQRRAETVGVHVALALSGKIYGEQKLFREGDDVLEVVGEDRAVIVAASQREPLAVDSG